MGRDARRQKRAWLLNFMYVLPGGPVGILVDCDRVAPGRATTRVILIIAYVNCPDSYYSLKLLYFRMKVVRHSACGRRAGA